MRSFGFSQSDGVLDRLGVHDLRLGERALRVDVAAPARRGRRQHRLVALAQAGVLVERAEAVGVVEAEPRDSR